jgi:F-type H+-transporting ATPase subunit a
MKDIYETVCIMHSPLEQFKIKEIIPIEVAGYDISITNSTVMMFLIIFLSGYVLVNGIMRKALVPGRFQSLSEMFYEFIESMVRTNIGAKGTPYIPFVLAVFMTVLFGNLLGMIPYMFTITSHIIVTGTLAILVFLSVTVIAIAKHGTHFFSFFIPEGSPAWLWPILIPIEVISYLSRPVSLSIRLFANMMAGHTMMKVFAGFSVSLIAAFGVGGAFLGFMPVLINAALVGFEILVALLQAYVFTILTCLYLKDALYLH